MNQVEIIKATFGQRMLSRIIDFIAVFILSIIPYAILLSIYKGSEGFRLFENQFSNFLPPNFNTVELSLVCLDLLILGFFLYYPILETLGGTIGKRVVGIKTIMIDTQNAPNIFVAFGFSMLLLIFFIVAYFVCAAIGSSLGMLDLFFVPFLLLLIPFQNFTHSATNTQIVKRL